MKSIRRRRLSVKKRLSGFLVLMLVVSVNLTAQSATQLPTEKKDLEDAAVLREPPQPQELTIEEVMEIAEEEIERTAQEAVKAALVEVGGELAYQTEMVNELEKVNGSLKMENKKLKEELQKKQNQFFYGALIGGAGGVVVTSLVFGLIGGLCK